MQPADLEERAAREGVLSRGMLLRSASPGAARWMLRTGDLVRLHRGVFVRGPLTAGRRAWGAAVAGGRDAVPSHLTAAAVHRLWLPPAWTGSPAEVLRGDGRSRGRRDDLLTSRARVTEADVVTLAGGLVVTGARRTVADLTARHGRFAGVIAAESAVRRGLLRPDELPAAIARLADPRSQSPLETAIRLLLRDAGIHGLLAQVEVWDEVSGRPRYLDLADPARRVAIEADGRVHADPEALYRDRVRQNVLVLQGWVVLRFTWWDVTRRPAYVVATVRRALARAA